ncbi:hypothetical protein GCM10023350_48670 [Nocardioides endophyticus]|uniref:Uncharacterized protein n=2 Tax=Nocardioides endophyticus TaxID=1353775 RepID=A0ABP8ZIN3_9ACTN
MMRPAEPADPVGVTPSAAYVARIDEARQHAEGREALKQASRAIIADHGVTRLDDLPVAVALLRLEAALRALAADAPAGSFVAAVTAAVKDALGDTPKKVIAAAATTRARETMQDLLIAAKLLSADDRVEAVRIETALRVLDLVRRIADGSGPVEDAAGLMAALGRSTEIGPLLPRRDKPSRQPEQPPPDDGPSEVDRLRERIGRLSAAADALTRLDPTAFDRPADKEGGRPDAQPSPKAFVNRRLAEAGRAGELTAFENGAVASYVADLDLVALAGDVAADNRAAGPRLVLTREAIAGLAPEVQKTMSALEVDLTATTTPTALERLGTELVTLHGQLGELENAESYVQLIGTSVVEVDGMHTWGKAGSVSVPSSHGSVQPVGVGDLLVVRQQIKKYEGGELAHIENVLDGESHQRRVMRAKESETTITVEEEESKEEERDSQTTERFELQREAASVVKDDVSLKAGLSVSGSYGPTVEFKASADFAMDHSKEESAKTASKYSKEVTERAASKVTERRRTQTVLRTLEKFEDTTEHGINNPAGNGHVIGAYQWVDKVYEAQVFNYGKRMMFDLMIPEPGAFWLHATTMKPMPGTSTTKPTPFTLTPAQIDEWNYRYYVHLYQVAGVKPPPAPYVAVSKTVDGAASDDDDGVLTKIADVPVPDGYQAVTANTTGLLAFWHDDWSVDYAVGKTSWRQNGGTGWSHGYTLGNEEGALPFAVKTFHVANVAVAVEVTCQRTTRVLDAWKLETHAAIQQGYLKLLRDYQDELAALQVQAQNAIAGRNPAENRQIERAELRKHAIATLTAQQFDLFGAVATAPEGFPELDLAEADAEGRYVRFFEQAFEWEQMMYLFYPYYWGRKTNWLNRALLQDVDPQFADFLKAGSARVVLPVRPGFETAVAHFLDTGEIWDGANPPLLTSPLYVSIIQEIKERDLAPGDEVAQGDPWDVRLPTTLVRLRPDGSLPTWAKDANGVWQPV